MLMWLAVTFPHLHMLCLSTSLTTLHHSLLFPTFSQSPPLPLPDSPPITCTHLFPSKKACNNWLLAMALFRLKWQLLALPTFQQMTWAVCLVWFFIAQYYFLVLFQILGMCSSLMSIWAKSTVVCSGECCPTGVPCTLTSCLSGRL